MLGGIIQPRAKYFILTRAPRVILKLRMHSVRVPQRQLPQLHEYQIIVLFDGSIIILLQISRRVRLVKSVSEEDVVIREVEPLDMLLFLLQKMELIQPLVVQY